ncbi:MAG TPA: thioredoxin [Gemmatimonadaceae bacterium]|nr:thioredoxin [Gemmatimonadaceae bacterium]
MIPAGQSLTVRCQFCQTWNRVDGARAADRPKCGHCSRFILLDRPFTLYEDTFERTVRESELPVFVDFYADWCGPCKMMAPAVDELAARNVGKALVAKLNTDLAPNTSGAFNIRGIPTSIVFVGGREVARQSGALPLAGLEQLLQRARGDNA